MAIKFNEDHRGTDHTTKEVVINYAYLAEPDKPKNSKIEPAYGCKICFDKGSDSDMAKFAEFQKAVMTVVKSAFPGITKAEAKTLNYPWKDGDKDYPNATGAFADMVRGCWVVEPKLKHKRKDGTVNPPIPCFEAAKTAEGRLIKRDPRDITSGNIVRVCIRLFAYEGFGGGVSARLKAVQYRDEGEAFSTDYGFGDDTPVLKGGDEIGDDLESLM